MTKKDIIGLYRRWRKENGNQMPNRAIVKIAWEDGDNADKGCQVDTIALESDDEPYPQDDAFILFYAGRGISGLLDLVRPNNGSGFIVLEVLEFYKQKNKYKLYPSIESPMSIIMKTAELLDSTRHNIWKGKN